MDKLAQIHRLKQILADLGMKGRLSLEQARSIRSKRELAQELRSFYHLFPFRVSFIVVRVIEDVQEFEKSVVSGPSRRSSRGTTKLASTDHAGDSEDELSDVPPVVRPVSYCRECGVSRLYPLEHRKEKDHGVPRRPE